MEISYQAAHFQTGIFQSRYCISLPIDSVEVRISTSGVVKLWNTKWNGRRSSVMRISVINLALLPSSQSVLIDDESVAKLKAIVTEQNVVVNIPFMLIGLGIILGGIFMFLMCRQKVPEVKNLCVGVAIRAASYDHIPLVIKTDKQKILTFRVTALHDICRFCLTTAKMNQFFKMLWINNNDLTWLDSLISRSLFWFSVGFVFEIMWLWQINKVNAVFIYLSFNIYVSGFISQSTAAERQPLLSS